MIYMQLVLVSLLWSSLLLLGCEFVICVAFILYTRLLRVPMQIIVIVIVSPNQEAMNE